VRDYIKQLEDRRVISESRSQWRNPIRALKKPNGEIRIVSNLIALNNIVKKDSFEIPEMRRLIDKVVVRIFNSN
jgi:hypothetical protein